VCLRLLYAALVMVALLAGCGGGGAQTSTDRVEGGMTANEFSVIVLPDTQCYTSNGAPNDPGDCGGKGNMQMFEAQVNWIRSNLASRRIKAVIGVGDIVECGESAEQWANAKAAYDVVDASGTIYVPALGGREYDSSCAHNDYSARPTRNYNANFGPQRFAGKSWYGNSSYPSVSNDNFFVDFETGGQKFTILALEFFPRDAALAWASGIVSSRRDRKVIVATHGYLKGTGERIVDSDPVGPTKYKLVADNSGQELWDKFLSQHENIILVLCGHDAGAARRADAGVAGNIVAQIHANYQFNGGNGYLRILTFRPEQNTIAVKTYSPYENQYRTTDPHEFTIRYGR